MKKTYFYLLFIFIFSLIICLPFLRSGFFETHDGQWAVIRLGAMHRSILNLQIPARWAGSQNFGYGYPLFEFTYPFPYYLGEAFNVAGLGLVWSVKSLFLISVFASAFAMFFLAKKIFGEEGAFIASSFYIFAPYRLVNLYVRGSIGESLALLFFPVLFYLVLKINEDKSYISSCVFSILLACFLLTHNVTALVFLPILILFTVVMVFKSKDRKKSLKKYLFGYFVAFLLSAFFIVPAIFEKKFIALSVNPLADITKNFATIPQLIFSNWNYGAYGTSNSFSPQLGIFHFLALILAFFAIWKSKDKTGKLVFGFSIVAALFLIFLMLPTSFIFWKTLPLFSNVDFPWRLLTPLIFFISLSSAALVLRKPTFIIGIVLVACSLVLGVSYAKPTSYVNFDDSYYFTNQATTTSNDELMPIWVKQKPLQMATKKAEVSKGNAEITVLKNKETELSLRIDSENTSKISVNTVYFPGWKVFMNRREADISFNNPKGVIEFLTNRGSHIYDIKFTDTPLRVFSNLLSVIGLIAVFILILWSKRFSK